jgi:pSer/pThr/pTyr-binding forkhead associated (FHA) protein
VADVVCNRCGHTNPIGANFCSSCGAALDAPTERHTTTMAFDQPEHDDDDEAVDLGQREAGAACLVVKRGPNVGSRFALDSDLVRAGRHPDSDIFLDDITVSRRHVEVERTPDGWRVRDVGSLNGTYVNRERVDEALLKDGDELQIGTFKLVFVGA